MRSAPVLKDAGSGVADWQPSLNGTVKEQWAGPWKTGEYLAEATAQDRVGNRAKLRSQRFFVDNKAPEIEWTIGGEWLENARGERFYRGPVSLTATARDEHTRNLTLFSAVADEE